MREFVLKVHSRCDLACDHCYVYEHRDQSWRDRPRHITPETVRAAAGRIAEHAAAYRLPSVTVILHGGEPLLLGPARLRATLAELHRVIAPVTRLELGMQTNGVLLSERLCDILLEFGVRVGVSLDGDRQANDRHRVFRDGSSSHDKVLRALTLLRDPRYSSLYSGLLCTVDLASDPVAAYDALLAEAPPRIDFLLPHATWDDPPAGHGSAPAPYARWLTTVYDRWRAGGRPTSIRLFEALLRTGAGRPSGTEWVGLDPVELAVIETDGAWEQADSLKTAYAGAPATGLDVFRHGADVVAATPELSRRRLGRAGLSATCQACEVVTQCGGGLFAHRWRTGTGFDNPSVYCGDLKELTRHVNAHPPAAPAVAPAAPLDLNTDLLPLELFDRIAGGGDDAEAVRLLAGTQLALTRALLAAVAGGAPAGSPAADAWALLGELDHSAPAAVRDVLAHPYLRPWALDLLSTGGRPGLGHDYLAAVAAAAAARAGVETELRMPVHQGRAYLPGVAVIDAPGAAWIDVHTGKQDTWQAMHRLGPGVLLEDADPYRECHGWQAGERLDAAAAARWQTTFAAAGRIMDEEVPLRAAGLRAGLRAVVPLHPSGPGASQASTAREAFGAVACTPADPQALAVLLVHEFQHGKLNALLDICDLVDTASPVRIKVGWRPDPRPVEGVLHGIYAHLAVADVWRVRADRSGSGPSEALDHFRQYRDWTAEAIGNLAAAHALTPAGARLLDRVSESMAGWPR